ncbi:hypothetical protein [Brachybacterium avium]|nr:hypothetical protein [Brachybacterium avium]
MPLSVQATALWFQGGCVPVDERELWRNGPLLGADRCPSRR